MTRMTIALCALLTLFPVAARAGTPEAPESIDVGGDAAGLNPQGVETAGDPNLQTAPASIDSADIRAIWLQTLYSTVKDLDAEGRVLRVRHVPHSLRVSIKTTAPVKPTFGPGMVFRVPATVGGCWVFFELFVAGSAPGANALERADLYSSCDGATLTTGITHAFEGTISTLTFPFDRSQGRLAAGVPMGPWTRPHSRVVLNTGQATGPTAPAIDQSSFMTNFTVAMDVPVDIDCTADPSNPECA